MKKIFPALVFAALSLAGCATGKPLVIGELDRIGWDKAGSFQCYLSSRLTLTRLSDDSEEPQINFSREGAAYVQEVRGTVVLPASLEGRILDYHRRDQYLYVAFEEGDATLPFARDSKGRFSLMSTIDQEGVSFVEYEGVRYKPSYIGEAPHLLVVIERGQADLRRQMQGSRTNALTAVEDAVKRAGEKLVGSLQENARLAVLNISADDETLAAKIMDDLELQLVESGKFTVVERKYLDTLRAEQNFQLSGEVSDVSAVSLGSMSGANIVITGALSGTTGARRLNLTPLDVQSAAIILSLREDF